MSADGQAVARLIHLSDIHFGFTEEDTLWERLVAFIKSLSPSAILISGDIVDTPKRRLFEKAKTALESFGAVPLLVCPGNHDRHLWGNALFGIRMPFGRDFFFYMNKWYVAAPNSKILPLGERLTARITAIDSSDKSSYFARSFVDPDTLKDLEKAMDEQQAAEEEQRLNLRVVLMHHHLLPIPALESDKDRLMGPFQTATTQIVNAGTILKTLAQSQVDVVLHGHEHHCNVARYTTLENSLGNVTVIGAGSATGSRDEAWHFDGSTFNVLEINSDESVWLAIYDGCSKSKTWSRKDPQKLFEAIDLRRARFYLRRDGQDGKDARTSNEAQGLKIHFRFLENTDVIVHRSYADATLVNHTFSFRAFSDTGEPYGPKVWIVDENNKRIAGDVSDDGIVQTRSAPHLCVGNRLILTIDLRHTGEGRTGSAL